MSIRKRANVSPELEASNRANAQHSTGPRTRQGKQRAAANALKHGLTAGAGQHAMRVLGEDPEEFQGLRERLLADYRPASETTRSLVMMLAELMWKQQRLARAEQALLARQVDELECRRARLERAVGQNRFEGKEADVLERGLRWQEDSPGKFEGMIVQLTFLLEMARQRDFSGSHKLPLKYGLWPDAYSPRRRDPAPF